MRGTPAALAALLLILPTAAGTLPPPLSVSIAGPSVAGTDVSTLYTGHVRSGGIGVGGVLVEVRNPAGSVLGRAETDFDGFYGASIQFRVQGATSIRAYAYGVHLGPVTLSGRTVGESPALDVTVYGRPSTPRDLIVSADSPAVALSWSPPVSAGGGPVSYRVYRSLDNASFELIATTTGTSFVDPDANASVGYAYGVAAANPALESAWARVSGGDPVASFAIVLDWDRICYLDSWCSEGDGESGTSMWMPYDTHGYGPIELDLRGHIEAIRASGAPAAGLSTGWSALPGPHAGSPTLDAAGRGDFAIHEDAYGNGNDCFYRRTFEIDAFGGGFTASTEFTIGICREGPPE